MGKHFEEDTRKSKRLEKNKKQKDIKSRKSEKNKKSSRIILKIIIILILLIITYITAQCIFSQKSIENKNENSYSKIDFQEKSVESEKLVLKSVYEYNKIIEYIFDNNKLGQIKILEQYNDKEKFGDAKENYSYRKDIQIISVDEENLIIQYYKQDFGEDTGLSYNEIYEKYMKIVGAYEKI